MGKSGDGQIRPMWTQWPARPQAGRRWTRDRGTPLSCPASITHHTESHTAMALTSTNAIAISRIKTYLFGSGSINLGLVVRLACT